MASAAPATDDHQVAKLASQLQIARLKREEEEELWISGEELCTEGSSDEEDGKATFRSNKSNKSNKSHDSARFAKIHWHMTEEDVTSLKFQKMYEQKLLLASEKTIVIFNVNDFSEDFAKDSEISWKANKVNIGYLLKNSPIKDRENADNSIETSVVQVQEEIVPIDNERSCGDYANTEKELMKQFFKVENLDAAIRELETNVQKVTEETLKLQLEHRRKLKETLSLKVPEIGRLAENTQKFFGLCKEYENVECLERD